MLHRAMGHVYTVGRHLADRVKPPPVPEAEPFVATVSDNRLGQIELTGALHHGADPLIVLVHGLGGSMDSGYMRRMAMAAHRRGHGVLRLNLRGADRLGADVYHAGLIDDLAAALAADSLARYSVRVVIGYSLGGHMSLRYAGESGDPGIAAVAAVCSPLDLAAGARYIDSPARRVYCRHLLRGLREIYGLSAPSISDLVGLEPAETTAIQTMRSWDTHIIAPRFGFRDADDYYAQTTALDVLPAIACPTLMVRAEADPMVSAGAAALDRVGSRVEIWRLRRGGHVGFPSAAALESRLLDWVATVAGPAG